MTEKPKRRWSDRWIPVIGVVAIAVLLVSAVFSTVALIGLDNAQHAADAAADAAGDAKIAAKRAEQAIAQAAQNTATLDDLCQLAAQQREELAYSVKATREYLASPVSDEVPAFSAYVETVSLPQTELRLKQFRVPAGCKTT